MVDAGKVARSGMGEISSLRVVASRRVALALAGALLLSFVTLARPASAAAHLSPSAVSPSVTTCTTFLEEGTAGNPQQLGYAFGRIWMTETAGTTGYLEGLDPLSLSMLQFVLPGPDAFDGSGMDVPLGVVGGPDLRVWFVGGYGQGYARVGRIDPAIPGGAYSFINLPTGSGPTHIVYAPLDGAFWISASSSDSPHQAHSPSTRSRPARCRGGSPSAATARSGSPSVARERSVACSRPAWSPMR